MALKLQGAATRQSSDGLLEPFSKENYVEGQSTQDIEAHYHEFHQKHLHEQSPFVLAEPNLADLGTISIRSSFGRRLKNALRFELFEILFTKQKQNAKELRSTAYVDGLRGYAALSVLLWHYLLPYYPLLANGYGLTGRESFLQLPILRTPLSPGVFSVTFAISGFVSSLSPLESIRAGKHEKLLKSLSGSVLRRWFRLNLPILASTFIINIMVQLRWYEHRPPWANEGFLQPPHSSIKVQFQEWLRMSNEWVNPFDGWNNFRASPFDSHTWSLNYEFHDSLILYLILLIVAKFKVRGRLLFYTVMCWYCFYVNAWHQLLFCGGLFIAELDFILDAPAESVSTSANTPMDAFNLLIFILGIAIIGQPQKDVPTTPGWSVILNNFTPSHWQRPLEPPGWYLLYPTMGALMILYSVTRLRFAQKWLEKPFAQYLAKHAFSLYLVHGPVQQTLGYNLNRWIFQQAGISNPNGDLTTQMADKFWTYNLSMLAGSFQILCAIFWFSELFQRHIEVNLNHLTQFVCDGISKL